MRFRSAIAALAAASALLTMAPADAESSDRAPLTGSESLFHASLATPPDGIRGYPLWDSWFDLSEYGYEEEEFLVSGQAVNASGDTADYTTRFIVFRPSEQADFNGTVVMDWVNVTSQSEIAVDSVQAQEMYLREGFAWVHVSAQKAGIGEDNGNPQTVKGWDGERYAAVDHPGDAYAYSMFSQIAKVLKQGSSNGIDPAGGLEVEYVLASGQSQSAGTLTNYVNNWQTRDQIIDGFLIHGTFANDGPPSSPVPVIHLESDADWSPTAKANLDGNVALWEIAGTSHVDYWIGYIKAFPISDRANGGVPKLKRESVNEINRAAGTYGEQIAPGFAACIPLGGAMPMRYATSAAIVQLDRWVRTGIDAPSGPKIQAGATGTTVDRVGDPTDPSYGNVRGGIRFGPVEHPVATYASDACNLGGFTVPFTDAQIIAMYGSHRDYYDAIAATTRGNVDAGFLLQADADDLMGRACDARNRFGILEPVDYCTGWAPYAG